MKKNVIALLLSVAVTAGSIMPAAAAENVPVMQEQEEFPAKRKNRKNEACKSGYRKKSRTGRGSI